MHTFPRLCECGAQGISRAEQSRAEQSKAEHSTAEQSRAEKSREEQSRAEQSREKQSGAEQSRAEQCQRGSNAHVALGYRSPSRTTQSQNDPVTCQLIRKHGGACDLVQCGVATSSQPTETHEGKGCLGRAIASDPVS